MVLSVIREIQKRCKYILVHIHYGTLCSEKNTYNGVSLWVPIMGRCPRYVTKLKKNTGVYVQCDPVYANNRNAFLCLFFGM